LNDLPYKPGTVLTDYERDRCKLDLYLPEGATGYPTLVWFHGGGLTAGRKDDDFTARIARSLAQAGVAVAAPNYRLSPKAPYPAYVEDAAAAFAWVQSNVAAHRGDPRKIFVGGHSAGGYLTLMVGLDSRYLRAQGKDTPAIAGLIPVSGQTMTHYTIREERGLNKQSIIADDAAPIHHARKDAPPMLVLYADKDMALRVEENQYLVAALKAAGHPRIEQRMITGRDHGTVAEYIAREDDPAARAILDFVRSTPPAASPEQRN
jgi:acetyl esterase/lipase